MTVRTNLFAALVVAICLLSASVVRAQVSASVAQLNGTVRDESGGTVAKASVSLRDTDTNHAYTTATNDTGYYVLANLPPGHYELKVSFGGFSNYTQTGLTLTVGATATIDIGLKVATKGEQVVVTGETPVIEPTKTEISQVIDTQEIDALPISARRFTDFALLTPGVATSRTSVGTTFTEFEATQISFGGMRSFSNEITVDGADFVNSNAGLQRSTPPQESVQEFRVVNNSFGAEYGRALGGIVNIVTKSGTNQMHGSAYEYFQDNSLDARSLLQPAASSGNPAAPNALRQNQFGATLGGPLRKDKTFFFLNYEGQRRSESPTLPPDLRDNFSEINLAKSYLGLAPEDLNILKDTDNDYGFARLDHELGASNHLAFRYNIENARDTNELVGNTEDGGGIGAPSGGRQLFIHDQSLVGTLSSTLKPNLINTFLGQYARRHYFFPGETGQPDLDIPNDLSFGHNFGTFDGINESRAQFSDSLAWVKGNHVAKFGADYNYLWDYTVYPGFTPERIILPNLNCLAEFANFVDPTAAAADPITFPSAPCPLPNGQPPFPPFLNFEGVPAVLYGVALARTGYVDGQPPLSNNFPLNTSTWANAYAPQLSSSYAFGLNHGYIGLFAQDQWRITQKLTVNYGLRWDVETGLGRQIDTDYRAWQPRVGFAFAPNSKTVIRAGFGIFFDRNNLTFFNVTGNQKTIPGFLPGITLPMIQTQAASGGWQLNQVVEPAFTPQPVTCPPGLIIPATPICAAASAVTAASILQTGLYPNQFITGTCPPSCTAGAGGLDRHHSRLPYAEQISLQIDREIGKGLTINVGYLFVGAHKLVLGNGLNTACPIGTTKPANPPNAQGWLNPDGTVSNCAGSPDPLLFGKPYFPSAGEFSNAGFLDYNISVVNANYHGLSVTASERIGRFFNLTANYTYSHSLDDGNFTTFINLPQNQFDQPAEYASSNQDTRHRFITNFTATGPAHGFLKNFQFSSIITMQSGRPFQLFTGADSNGDTNAYTDRPGLTGRNAYTGDPLYAWDLRLSRYFQIKENVKLDLMFDAFNVLNRPNVDEVVDVYGAPEICGAVPFKYKDGPSRAIQAGSDTCAVQPSVPNAPAADGPWLTPSPGAPPPNPSFGTPRTMLNPRQLQLSAKLSF